MKSIANLPSPIGLTKKEILDILLREEYGEMPELAKSVSAEEIKCDTSFCAGKASLKTLKLTCRAGWGEYSFPVYYACPAKGENIPAFIHINFRSNIPDIYQPTEELIDSGYATLTFCYEDVTKDNNDFESGLSGVIYPGGKRENHHCGKIGLWALATIAVMEYAQTLPELNKGKISVVGHSRLGKTALLAGALDERFYCAFSNDSGCSGAAISRENTGESIRNITRTFPFWFCENYQKYADNENLLEFDQHYLIAGNAPHRVYVASAGEDSWACPENEFISCVEAGKYYESIGILGLVHDDVMPSTSENLHDGYIGYHIRDGKHYLGREDWQRYISFLGKHK